MSSIESDAFRKKNEIYWKKDRFSFCAFSVPLSLSRSFSSCIVSLVALFLRRLFQQQQKQQQRRRRLARVHSHIRYLILDQCTPSLTLILS